MTTLKKLVADLPKKTKTPPPPPDQHIQGHTSVTVAFGDGHAVVAIADWGQPFKSKTIQRIWDTVKKYEVGAW